MQISARIVFKSAREYLTSMIAYVSTHARGLTNFKPGSRVRTILESLALELAAAAAEFWKAFQKAIRESCYRTFGFALKPGTTTAGQLRVTYDGHQEPHAVPVFRFRIFGRQYETLHAAQIAVGSDYTDVDFAAVEPGSQYNLQAGALDTDLGIGDIEGTFEYDRIHNPFPADNGTDRETEAEREDRFQVFINNLARSTLQGIHSGVTKVPGVVDAWVTENVNPFSGDPETGWILAYVTDGSANPPAALLAEVEKTINGDPADSARYPGYRAAGTRLWVGAILVQPILLTYRLELYENSELTDSQAIAVASDAIQDHVNRLETGNDVIAANAAAAAYVTGQPDFFRVTIIESDVVVSKGYVPKIGGTGGGSVACVEITRTAHP